ncbi:hypothetical protein EON64_19260 [archaeon]|nr:MAG: hypothetical protein EON64_19260 [archaeon]
MGYCADLSIRIYKFTGHKYFAFLIIRWHCSVPGPTDPNRAFAMSGTSAGILTNFNGTYYTQTSYFEYLRQHNR